MRPCTLKGSNPEVTNAVYEQIQYLHSFWYISNKVQHYTIYLFLENCCTCFRWYLHPSSGAHTTVLTVSGTCQTVTVNTVCAPDDGWRYHPKHVEQFSRISKLRNVASCWKYIKRNILKMHGPLNVKKKRYLQLMINVS